MSPFRMKSQISRVAPMAMKNGGDVISSPIKLDPLEVIKFHPVTTIEEFHHPPIQYSPLFTHHFFGDDNLIYGFDSSLIISFYYIPSSFEVYLCIEFDRSQCVENGGSTQLQELRDALCERTPFPGGFVESKEIFEEILRCRESQTFIPYGKCIHYVPFKFKNVDKAMYSTNIELFLQIQECSLGEEVDDTHNGVKNGCVQTAVNTETDEGTHCDSAHKRDVLKESTSTDSTIDIPFSKLHRRMEWFLHWFIEGASNVESDERWRVILPYIVAKGGPLYHTQHSHKRKATVHEEVHKKKRGNDRIIRVDSPMKCGVTTTNKSTDASHLRYHLTGFATTYNFFSINQNRRRISQFMIYPHMQHNGIGMELLERIYYEATKDENVCEITVEDPASTFTQLRDIVSLQTCFRLRYLSPELLYPEKTSCKDKTRNGKEKQQLQSNNILKVASKRALIKMTKETPRQATRMQETLMLARVLPVSKMKSEVSSPDRRKKKGKTRPQHNEAENCGLNSPESAVYSDELLAESDVVKPVRILVKKRLRKDHIDDFADLPGVGLSCGGNDAYKELVKAELRNKWMEHFAVYSRTIRKLRNHFPIDAASKE